MSVVAPLWVMDDGRKYRIEDLSDERLYSIFNELKELDNDNPYRMYWFRYINAEIMKRGKMDGE